MFCIFANTPLFTKSLEADAVRVLKLSMFNSFNMSLAFKVRLLPAIILE